MKYVHDGTRVCRVPKQRGGDAHFDAIPVNQLFDENSIKLIRQKTGDRIIKENPFKDNEGTGAEAESKDEYVMDDEFKGKLR